MRRISFCALMMSLALTLCACAGKEMSNDDFAAAVQEKYRAVSALMMQVKLRCDVDGAVRDYVLDCVYERGGDHRVTVKEPQELAGISASVSGTSLALQYDGVTLEAGGASDEVCAANAAAYAMEAVMRGYVLEQGRSEWNGEACRRLALEMPSKGKAQMLCTVCLAEDMTPLYAQIAKDGAGFIDMEFTSFAFGDIIDQNT